MVHIVALIIYLFCDVLNSFEFAATLLPQGETKNY